MGDRMNRIALALSAAILASLVLPAQAQTAPPGSDDSRFSFHKIDDGFLRLDGRTGQVSRCSLKPVGWSCEMVPDERSALEDEIGRLQGHNATLKKELLTRGLPLPGTMKSDDASEPPVAKRDVPQLKLPTDADLDRVRSFIGKIWRRFVDMINDLQRDALRKT